MLDVYICVPLPPQETHCLPYLISQAIQDHVFPSNAASIMSTWLPAAHPSSSGQSGTFGYYMPPMSLQDT